MAKLCIFIRDPEAFYKGNYASALTLEDDRELIERIFPEWIFVREIEIDVDVETSDVVQAAITSIDEQISKVRAEAQAQIDQLEDRKQDLLAIGGPE